MYGAVAFMAMPCGVAIDWRLWQGRDGRRKNRDGRAPGLLTQVLQSFTRRCGMLNVFEHYIFMSFFALAGGAAAKAFANAEAEARRCAICTPRILSASELRKAGGTLDAPKK